MRWLKKGYSRIRHSFTTHIAIPVTISVIVLLFAAMLIFQFYVKNQYFTYLLEETDRREAAVLEAVAANLDNSLQNVVGTACRIAINSEFRDMVETTQQERTGRAWLMLREEMALMAQYSSSIAAVTVVNGDGVFREYGKYWERGGYENLWIGENLEVLDELYRRVKRQLNDKTTTRYCASAAPARHASIPGAELFHLAVPLVGGRSGWDSVDNVVVVTFRLDAILDEDTLSGYMTDEKDGIIYHEDPKYIGLDAAEYQRLFPKYEDISRGLRYFGWTAHASIDVEAMHARVNRLYHTGIFVYLLLLFACALIWLLFIQRLLRPVGDIRDAMEDVRLGRKREKIPIDGSHEIWQLAEDYNAMLDALHEQQEETERQYQEKTLSMKQKNRAEREALESQINAHFLCNTLTAINYNAVEAGNEEVADLLKNLSNMLSYSFSRKNVHITLGQEIRWVEEYLYLQKFRLMEVFDYRIDFPDEYGEWPSCKLFLQPFVENSIQHGFEGREKGGLITISGCPDGKRFRLSIRDNGCGMAEDVESVIQRILREEHVLDLHGVGIGVQNAVTRLRMYYGKEFAVTMETKRGEGTCFTFWLPLVVNQEEDFA